jgi:hypothetical protein
MIGANTCWQRSSAFDGASDTTHSASNGTASRTAVDRRAFPEIGPNVVAAMLQRTALLNHNDKGVTGIYARWHMFEEKREAVLAIEAAALPLTA